VHFEKSYVAEGLVIYIHSHVSSDIKSQYDIFGHTKSSYNIVFEPNQKKFVHLNLQQTLGLLEFESGINGMTMNRIGSKTATQNLIQMIMLMTVTMMMMMII